MARRLAGPEGVVLETDEYFYKQVGNDPERYDYSKQLLPTARDWNFHRFGQALAEGISPIVVDRGNGLNPETRRYVLLAQEQGYHVEFREPDSPWWQELRVLLKYKEHVAPELLDFWAESLAERSRKTHRVPVATIRRWMQSWRSDLTVEDVLNAN
jgi:hypothetical protein